MSPHFFVQKSGGGNKVPCLFDSDPSKSICEIKAKIHTRTHHQSERHNRWVWNGAEVAKLTNCAWFWYGRRHENREKYVCLKKNDKSGRAYNMETRFRYRHPGLTEQLNVEATELKLNSTAKVLNDAIGFFVNPERWKCQAGAVRPYGHVFRRSLRRHAGRLHHSDFCCPRHSRSSEVMHRGWFRWPVKTDEIAQGKVSLFFNYRANQTRTVELYQNSV